METSITATTPTIYDVAARAGVSIATVSRVLNSRAHTAGATRERVIGAVADLGFVPNGAARGLSRGLKRVIGVVFATGDESLVEEESLLFTDSVIRGAESGASQHGYSLLLNGSGPGAPVAALTGKVDGLILLDQVLPEKRVASLARRVPVVLLAGSGRVRSAVTVRVDNAAAMRTVAEHLVDHHGMRHLAFMSGLASSPDSVTRAAHFVRSATARGATVEPPERWSADWTSGGAAGVTRECLAAGGTLPQGIVCANDQMAIGVMHALAGAGYRVPDDVALVGFDDIFLARHLSPALTSVRQPSRQLGAAAVDALVTLVEGRPLPSRDIVLPTELRIRASCGCPAAASDNWTVRI
ncbi:MAG: LacI family DNA-binding transcriptional regulator [Acidimicrobiales bacterium]